MAWTISSSSECSGRMMGAIWCTHLVSAPASAEVSADMSALFQQRIGSGLPLLQK